MGEDNKNFQEKRMGKFILQEDESCESCLSSSSLLSLPPSSLVLDDDDDASSSPSSNCPQSLTSCRPLYELSQLMDHLPIKRGLSKFYNGKSQSFASLADAESRVEDLAKKGRSYSRRMKWSKGYGRNVKQQITFCPKAIIAKRSPRRSYSSCLTHVDSF